MILLDILDYTTNSDLDIRITRYFNKNVEIIIRVLLDYLSDDSFTPDDFLPYNNLDISSESWVKMTKDLYDIVRSNCPRRYIKPTYEYLLYVIFSWWEDTNDIDELIPQKIDVILAEEIKSIYASEDDGCYVLYAVTNFTEYFYIPFMDLDFLPNNVESLTSIYLYDNASFNEMYPDVDLDDYIDLMPSDLKERYISKRGFSPEKEKSISEPVLMKDLLFCCERVQQNPKYIDATEDERNDFIRDLLTSKGYDLRDQTRQGKSARGKKPGEVDILVRSNMNPFSIIEALCLTYLDQPYISEHIDKVYKYDTIGNICNFVVAYVTIKDFESFWKKYIDYIKSYPYHYDLLDFQIPNSMQWPEIRRAVATLNRNGMQTKLYFIAAHIPMT